MSNGWMASELLFDAEGLGQWLTQHEVASALVVHDPSLADSAIVARVRARMTRARVAVHLLPCPRDADDTAVPALAAALQDVDVVVAVGGGSVIDRAKLAVAVDADKSAWPRLRARQRSGLVVLPPAPLRRRRLLMAVPTTIGTGSESSAVAIMDTAGRRQLVASAALRPDLALLDPVATATLPTDLVLEGALEILTRVVGPYVADEESRPVEDALAETMAAGVARQGAAAVNARNQGELVPSDVRMALAKWSVLSHLGWHNLGRDPYGYRVWYLATELSAVAGVRKMTAQRALLPPVLRRIAEGDRRWGCNRPLTRAWTIIRDASSTFTCAHHDDARHGFGALLTEWCPMREMVFGDVDPTIVARRCHRAWGGGLPMLSAFTVGEIEDVIKDATIGH